MNEIIMRVLLLILGVITFASVLVLEIDGNSGFLLATLGVFLIIISLSLKGIIKLLADLF